MSCCRARRENHVRKTTAQRTRVTRDGGQALVEFALVLPVLMIATFAILLTAEVGVARLSLQHATAELMHMLADDHGLDFRASSALLGQCIRYDIANVFDPAYTVVAKVARDLLP